MRGQAMPLTDAKNYGMNHIIVLKCAAATKRVAGSGVRCGQSKMCNLRTLKVGTTRGGAAC